MSRCSHKKRTHTFATRLNKWKIIILLQYWGTEEKKNFIPFLFAHFCEIHGVRNLFCHNGWFLLLKSVYWHNFYFNNLVFLIEKEESLLEDVLYKIHKQNSTIDETNTWYPHRHKISLTIKLIVVEMRLNYLSYAKHFSCFAFLCVDWLWCELPSRNSLVWLKLKEKAFYAVFIFGIVARFFMFMGFLIWKCDFVQFCKVDRN